MASSKDSQYFYYRSEFDKTLRKYFKEKIDLSILPTGFNLDILEISALILLVERENEIKDFPQSPPERYTKTSFLEDVDEIGIGADAAMEECLKHLITLGFVQKEAKLIRPSETAFKMVGFINSFFPGMPGINFIAYIVQTIEEVHSKRKMLEEGKAAFFQTLKSRGAKSKKASSSSAGKTIKKRSLLKKTDLL